MALKKIPKDCAPDKIYLYELQQYGMQSVYIDKDAPIKAEKCADALSNDVTKYESVRVKVACMSDDKFGNIWGYKIKKVKPK